MKKIIIPLLFIVIALVITPFFIGSQAEDKVREMFAKASEYPDIKFEITEYNQGWFSSNVKIKLNIDVAGISQSEDDSLIITQKMQHGPLLWESGGLGFGLADIQYGVELPKEIQAEMDKMEGLKSDSISVISRLSFNGSSTSSIIISPFTMNKDDHKVIIKAGQFDAIVDVGGKITLNGNWQGMQVKEENHTLVEMEALSINMDQSLVEGEMFSKTALFEGDFSFEVDSLKVEGYSRSDSFKIKNISIGSTTKFNQDLAHMTIKFGAKSISAIGQEFEDFIYDISFDNLNKQTILAMNNMMYDGGNPDALMQDYENLLPGLIEKNPALKIILSVKTSVGEISSNTAISIDKEMYQQDNPMSLMQAIDATSSGYAPESFVYDLGLSSDIEMMVQQNMLVRDNQQIKFDARFKNGELLLNGAPMPMGF